MESINTTLDRKERIRRGTQFARETFEAHSTMQSIYMFGSTVRGDNLPVSDLDMHYLVSREIEPLPVKKGVYHGVLIDIEPDIREDLTIEAVLGNAYLFGLITDSNILFDRTGYMTELQSSLAEEDTPELLRGRADKLLEPVRRNLAGFRAAIECMDHAGLCKTAGFVMWCLADYLLARHGKPPGGFRTLSRVKAVDAAAYWDIVDLQGTRRRAVTELQSFSDFAVARHGQEKNQWLFQNGFKHEAFHRLWICLGLEIKGLGDDWSSGKAQDITTRCRGWLDRLGWTTADVLRKKAANMEGMLERHAV